MRKLLSVLIALCIALLPSLAFTPAAYACPPHQQDYCLVPHYCTLVSAANFDPSVYPGGTVVLYHIGLLPGGGTWWDYYYMPGTGGTCSPTSPSVYPANWGVAITDSDGSGELYIVI